MTFDTTSVVNTAIGALPGIIGLIRADHAARNPGAPPLTDEQVMAGLQSAVASSVAKDEQWLAQHPKEGGPSVGSDVPGGGASD
jgi:hypothetical protein